MHPLDILKAYRLGSRQATAELQRTDMPAIHIDFRVFQLVEDVQQRSGQAVILTGTAGDGKTYLAYRIIEALGLDLEAVRRAQARGGYDQAGVFIDLDLSAGPLTTERVERLCDALAQPECLTLICANEGKLAELEERLKRRGQALPEGVRYINLSRRALVGPDAWPQILQAVVAGDLWQDTAIDDTPSSWNRLWLQDDGVAERLRRYLLLPYLMGEPITIRETLSFLAYALGGGLNALGAQVLSDDERIIYLLFNTVFSEPEGYVHGGRAAPTEKLLWWLFRFDPGDRASPEMDLRLLVELEELQASPPAELLRMWRRDLIVREGERSDVAYRRRLARYMRYARRWYALACEEGFQAYFPFRHFSRYLRALQSSPEELKGQIPDLIQGLNLLLSGGHVEERYGLRGFYLPADGSRAGATIYAEDRSIPDYCLRLETDLPRDVGEGDEYLERFPRRLYLSHERTGAHLPVSLLLYEVLLGALGTGSSFPATLWAKERDTVVRFVSQLGRGDGANATLGRFVIQMQGDQGPGLNLRYDARGRRIEVA